LETCGAAGVLHRPSHSGAERAISSPAVNPWRAVRDALPPFAAASRVRGTPEEIQAVVAGSVAHFGRYTVDDQDISFQGETSTYPNWNGSLQKRAFSVSGDELKYGDAASSAGGRVELVWRRAR
jgi:hypothetical protein